MPDSLECQRALIKARKINPLRPSTNAVLNALVYNWKLQFAAEAVIEEELTPKRTKIQSTSKLDLGDQIDGKMIEGFSTHPISRPEVRADSGRHRGQFSEASGFVFCQVSYTYYELPVPRLLLGAGFLKGLLGA